MKIIVLGDTHGRTIWKQIVEKEQDADIIVFIGDYFDTKEQIDNIQQLSNFKEIIEYKRQNFDKVVLLTGNHDFHYLPTSTQKYSGYQYWSKTDFGEVLSQAIKDENIQMCFKYENYLMTHAGITKTWATKNNIDLNNIDNSINELFKYQPNQFEFTIGRNRDQYGDDITQTPIWVRPWALGKDGLDNYIQVVGHTEQDSIQITPNIILIDTLGTSKEYLEINNKQTIIKTI